MPSEFRFPVRVGWDGGRRIVVSVEGKQPLPVAPPPEFRGTDPGLWSPEDALVAAAASCLAVTVAGLAERARLTLHALDVDAVGVVGRRADGRFGFVRVEQAVALTTDPGHEEEARALVEQAEEGCLVSVSLDLPVETVVDVRAAAAATHA